MNNAVFRDVDDPYGVFNCFEIEIRLFALFHLVRPFVSVVDIGEIQTVVLYRVDTILDEHRLARTTA